MEKNLFKLDDLYKLLYETTFEFRKGEVVEEGKYSTEIYGMPHVEEADKNLVMVDVEFEKIGVNKIKSEEHREEFIEILDNYMPFECLEKGPSYIEVGAVIGDQSMAFRMFALGEVLGLWKVITPATFHLTGEDARTAAGNGFIMISGYKQQKE